MKIFTAIFRVKKEYKKAKNSILSLDTHGFEDAEAAVEEMYDLQPDYPFTCLSYLHAADSEKQMPTKMKAFPLTNSGI